MQERLYRLRIWDIHNTAYHILLEKERAEEAMRWLQNDPASDWLELSGFDDESDRRPLRVVIAAMTMKKL